MSKDRILIQEQTYSRNYRKEGTNLEAEKELSTVASLNAREAEPGKNDSQELEIMRHMIESINYGAINSITKA